MQAQLFVMISHTGLSRNLWGGQTVTITITFLPSLPQIHFSLLPFPWLPYNHFANGSAFELISRYRHHQDHYEKLRPSKQHCPNWEQKGRRRKLRHREQAPVVGQRWRPSLHLRVPLCSPEQSKQQEQTFCISLSSLFPCYWYCDAKVKKLHYQM